MVDFLHKIIIMIKKGDFMSTKISGSSLLSGISSGLTSTYSLLAQANTGGVTLESIAEARTSTSNTNVLNQNFASYMQTNFSTLDKDSDGKISSTEMSDMTNQIANQGLTQAQLTQLGSASGMSSAALSEVLDHFSEIDANNDGKVTTAEISAYNITASKEKKQTEFANRAATNMSVFYGDDSASVADSSSILDFKYSNGDNS